MAMPVWTSPLLVSMSFMCGKFHNSTSAMKLLHADYGRADTDKVLGADNEHLLASVLNFSTNSPDEAIPSLSVMHMKFLSSSADEIFRYSFLNIDVALLLQKCHRTKIVVFQEICEKTVSGCGRLDGHVANTIANWFLDLNFISFTLANW